MEYVFVGVMLLIVYLLLRMGKGGGDLVKMGFGVNVV